MHLDLTDKTAMITGSTQGIGFAAAAGLLEAGAAVIVNGRTADRVEEAVRRLGGGERVRGVAADIGTAAGCEELIAAVPAVDVLVNNAGVFNPQPVFEIPDDEWQRLFDVNLMSGVRLARHYVPAMVDRDWGRVVFVSSESALHIPPEMVHYGMTKLAQLGVSRGIAESVAGSGVTVNSVLPGPTRSEGLEAAFREMVGEGVEIDDVAQMMIERERPTSIIKRLATVEEVANLIVYVASPQASATTGAALRVDGGVVRAVA